MTITNRDELIEELLKSSLMRKDWPETIANHVFDWLSEQGFGLVPLEPDWRMEDAYEGIISGTGSRGTGPIKAANEAGDLLKRRDG